LDTILIKFLSKDLSECILTTIASFDLSLFSHQNLYEKFKEKIQKILTKNSVFLNIKSFDKIRILLWDIDGTLMSSTVAGAYKEYFAPALVRVYGSSGKLTGMQVSGMTDTQIAYEALKEEGFTPEQILAEKDNFLQVFKEEMSRVISKRKNPYKRFAGTREILDKTKENPIFINGLLTGNLSVAAKIKLSHVDLWKYFKNVPHSFGEISHDRRELAIEAGKIYSDFLKAKLKPEQFIVIGDTPNDIVCARAFGAKVISVATGRNHSVEELSKHNPDFLLDNLKNTDEILRIIEEF
jgi:phosphoglycolate phosphatase-like HAD superfamily hydrolase